MEELLREQVHGASTQIIKTTDFTIDGYLPKSFLAYYTPPGHLPRKVQIDRLKRLYLSMHIGDLLRERGLLPNKLMPSHRPADEVVVLSRAPTKTSMRDEAVVDEDAAPFPCFLPLDYFDNVDYEIWTPQEWLNKGVDQRLYKPLPGRALLPNVDSHLFSKLVVRLSPFGWSLMFKSIVL
jgi:hypothetical protein